MTSDEASARRSAAILAMVMALVAVSVAVFVPSWLAGRARASLEREAVGIVSVGARAAAPSIATGDSYGVSLALDGVLTSPDVVYTAIRQGDKVLGARNPELLGDVGTVSGVGARYGGGLLHVAVAVPAVTPGAVFQAGFRLDDLWRQRTANLAFASSVAGLLLIAALGAALRARRIGMGFFPEEVIEESTTQVFSGDTFISWLSVELRTPLTAILGYSEILQEDATYLGQPDLVPDLKTISRAGGHMLALLDDVVSLQRVFTNTLGLEVTSFDLNEMVQEVEGNVSSLVNRTLVTLEIEASEGLGTIRADRPKLVRAVTNVLREAAGATGQGELTMLVARDADEVVFQIRHPDLIVSADEITTMFRAMGEDRTRTLPQYHQTGLGLVISREFCRVQGGDLRVDSGDDGTLFELRVPISVG